MVKNTCAFDSLSQILIVSAFTNMNAAEKLIQLSNNYDYFKFIILTLNHNIITPESYRRRYELLMLMKPRVITGLDEALQIIISKVDCWSNVCGNVFQLLSNYSGLTYRFSACTKGCPEFTRKEPSIYITANVIYQSFEDMLDIGAVIRYEVGCPTNYCDGRRNKTLIETGNFLYIKIIILIKVLSKFKSKNV